MSRELTPEEHERGAAAARNGAAAHARLKGIAIPIYAEKDNGVLFLTGSAFLLDIQDATFFITAEHTLQTYKTSPLWVPADGKPFGVNADFTHTRTTGVVDLAFARLDDRMAPMMQGCRRLELEDLDVSDWPTPHRVYTFIGYPSSANKANLKTKSLQPTLQPYSSHKPLLLEEYEPNKLNPCSAIAVHFDLGKAEEEGTRRIVQPKSPVGISGGPVFRIGSFQELQEGTNQEKVVGLGIAPRQNSGMLIGARIGLVVEAIRKKHPDLSDTLPTNPRCRINVELA